MSTRREIPDWGPELGHRVEHLQVIDRIRDSSEARAYLVGGAVRDLLLGIEPEDLDIAVDGSLDPILESLDGEVKTFPVFETASISLPGGGSVDLARTRREVYEAPGSLPAVEPAPIDQDLARRDFSINAMAVPLDEPETLIDPFDGRGDLERGLIRLLHGDSLRDDPTRAFRCARYAARLKLEADEDTARQIAQVDLGTVSSERIASEIELCAREECAVGGLSKAADWKLVSVPEDLPEILREICAVLGSGLWAGFLDTLGIDGYRALAAAVLTRGSEDESEELRAAREIVSERPPNPAAIASVARRSDPLALVIARSLGASWLDAWPQGLDSAGLVISGDDLLAVGVPSGPLIGVGLEAALAGKLNMSADDREAEMRIALDACRRAGWQEDRK